MVEISGTHREHNREGDMKLGKTRNNGYRTVAGILLVVSVVIFTKKKNPF